MTSILLQLSQLISQSVSNIEKTCTQNGVEVPHINSLFNPQSEAFRMDPIVGEAIEVATAAAYQLIAILQPPQVSISLAAIGQYKTVALRALLETNTIEILREAGPEGLHVNEIASKNGLDPQKTARLLRYLATFHVFREVEPDIFANNRISSILDTGKTVTQLKERPLERHDGTPGFAALLEHVMDEGCAAASSAVDVLHDERTKLSEEPTDAPFSKAFNTRLSIWEWFEQPDQQYRLRRFGIAMQGVSQLQPASTILDAFDWKSLPADATVMDVGAGVGTVSLVIAKAFPNLHVVVQDRPAVIEHAKEVWNAQAPEAVQSGRVTLEAHDFFSPQPARKVSIFILKNILHDWSDSYALKILAQLRRSSSEDTKLLLVEIIIPYACRGLSKDLQEAIPGAIAKVAPQPLLANYGPVNIMPYCSDLNMFFLQNGQERTIGHFKTLLAKAGWQLNRIHRNESAAGFMNTIEAIPK